MNRVSVASILLVILSSVVALAQGTNVPTQSSMKMEMHGSVVTDTRTIQGPSFLDLGELNSGLPTDELSKVVQTPVIETNGTTRSVKDAQLYRTISPSVVYVVNKEGFGSGSLLDAAGDILTNWHVVNGYQFVAVIFKPRVDGHEPTREDIKLAHVVKYDVIADLALIKASEIPPGRIPIRLGGSSEIAVGMDVHAIGHPEGDSWTYTTGVISQYRRNYAWREKRDSIQHKADVVQTQTPINPGNSGGPLLSDSGDLIGVNTFKDPGAEGLNFAVSVEDVRRFLARSGNRTAEVQISKGGSSCKARKLATFRSKENDATVVSFDLYCTGKDNAEYVVPDDKKTAVFLRLDRNGDGKADVIIFDFKRSGKWDISFWDTKFNGQWDLVGYHDDGTLKPTRFESYATFEKRVVSSR